MLSERYITTWRKPAPDILEWDYYISDSLEEAQTVVDNLKKQGVRQWGTYPLGKPVEGLSQQIYTVPREEQDTTNSDTPSG